MTKNYLDNAGLSHLWEKIKALLSSKSDNDHTHTLEEVSDTSSYVKMTTTEREKLADIEEGANKTVVDTQLDMISQNPISNQAVAMKLAFKSDTGHVHFDATTSTSGFMSSDDKAKLDELYAKIEELETSGGGFVATESDM